MAKLNRIQLHPVKGLDPIEVDRTTVENCGLAYDRRYAVFDADGDYINGREDRRIQRLRTTFDRASETLSLRRHEDPPDAAVAFDIDDDRAALEDWLSEYFDEPVTVGERDDTRFTDYAGGLDPHKTTAAGPSIVSTETYREVASWFPDLDLDGMRGRFRTNLEIDGTPAFWEDRLFDDANHLVEFRIGDVRLQGVMPVPRCVVPTRDPMTAERDREFTSVFSERREEKFPEWADADHLGQHISDRGDHYFYLTVVTRIPDAEGRTLAVGDEVEVLEKQPLPRTG
jgi:uncharacterized protein YcbX